MNFGLVGAAGLPSGPGCGRCRVRAQVAVRQRGLPPKLLNLLDPFRSHFEHPNPLQFKPRSVWSPSPTPPAFSSWHRHPPPPASPCATLTTSLSNPPLSRPRLRAAIGDEQTEQVTMVKSSRRSSSGSVRAAKAAATSAKASAAPPAPAEAPPACRRSRRLRSDRGSVGDGGQSSSSDLLSPEGACEFRPSAADRRWCSCARPPARRPALAGAGRSIEGSRARRARRAPRTRSPAAAPSTNCAGLSTAARGLGTYSESPPVAAMEDGRDEGGSEEMDLFAEEGGSPTNATRVAMSPFDAKRQKNSAAVLVRVEHARRRFLSAATASRGGGPLVAGCGAAALVGQTLREPALRPTAAPPPRRVVPAPAPAVTSFHHPSPHPEPSTQHR